MEDLLAKLEDHTKQIMDIMLLSQSSFKIVDYLYVGRPDLEIEVIRQNQFLKYTREIHWRIYVTELSKLLSSRTGDWYNLTKFIDKFKDGHEFNGFKEITDATITAWENQLLSVKDKISNLLLQRDKLYSHTDKNRATVKNELSVKDARHLIQIVQKVVYEIYDAVFGRHVIFDPVGEPLDDLKKIMEVLVDKKKELISFYIDHCKEKGIDPTTVGLPSDKLS